MPKYDVSICISGTIVVETESGPDCITGGNIFDFVDPHEVMHLLDISVDDVYVREEPT